MSRFKKKKKVSQCDVVFFLCMHEWCLHLNDNSSLLPFCLLASDIMGQSFNLQGITQAFRVLASPRLMVPHLIVRGT